MIYRKQWRFVRVLYTIFIVSHINGCGAIKDYTDGIERLFEMEKKSQILPPVYTTA